MRHVSQRQSSLSLLNVCVSPSNDLFYTCIVHSHNPDKFIKKKVNYIRSYSSFNGYQTLLRLYE